MPFIGFPGVIDWTIELSCPKCHEKHTEYILEIMHKKVSVCPGCNYSFQVEK